MLVFLQVISSQSPHVKNARPFAAPGDTKTWCKNGPPVGCTPIIAMLHNETICKPPVGPSRRRSGLHIVVMRHCYITRLRCSSVGCKSSGPHRGTFSTRAARCSKRSLRMPRKFLYRNVRAPLELATKASFCRANCARTKFTIKK